MNAALPPEESPGANSERIRELREQIADLKKRWPAHSTPPALMQQLDDLEEALENELARANRP